MTFEFGRERDGGYSGGRCGRKGRKVALAPHGRFFIRQLALQHLPTRLGSNECDKK